MVFIKSNVKLLDHFLLLTYHRKNIVTFEKPGNYFPYTEKENKKSKDHE